MKRHALTIIVQQFASVARLPDIRRLKKELLLDIMEAVADYMSSTPSAPTVDDGEEKDIEDEEEVISLLQTSSN